MSTTIYVVDAFTNKPFSGNPAGVCILQDFPSDAWLQSVAAEMNHAETAFLVPIEGGYHLRWFTPTNEVELCGHATLASAHILNEIYGIKSVQFRTLSGELQVTTNNGVYEMNFPALNAARTEVPIKLTGLPEPIWCGESAFDWILIFDQESDVIGYIPNQAEIANLGKRGLIISSRSQGEQDVVSRCFYPNFGVPEDPATGSAHCVLGPYWSQILQKNEIKCLQASSRQGHISVKILSENRLLLTGQAVTTLKSELLVTVWTNVKSES